MRNVIVYDDFFKDPDGVRATVLKNGFRPVQPGGTYPGRMSNPYVTPGILPFFSSVIGTEARLMPDGNRSWFGEFRVSVESDSFEQWIHIDPIGWSAIAYLNPEGTYPEGFGTAFWKHKETGWYGFPGTATTHTAIVNEEAKAKGFEDFQSLREKIIYKDGLDESKWELDMFVPGKYNRIVIFRPTLWHSHMPKFNFGNSDETGRLIQLFFFEEARL